MSFVSGAGSVLRRSRSGPRAVCASRAQCRASASVSREEVSRTAQLAQLQLTDAEVDTLLPEFQKIIGFIDTLSELDVEGVEPMSRVEDTTNILRDDVPVAFPNMYVDACVKSMMRGDVDFMKSLWWFAVTTAC
jgi:aspartyl-tRNA(Asn)/glutamyl-tRNA(Gln) amidotransferase subunit C